MRKTFGASRRAESARSYAVIRGYHEDDGGGFKLLEAARHLGPVEMGQVQIHQNELRSESGGIEERLAPIGGGADHDEARVQGEEAFEGPEHEGRVIYQECPDAVWFGMRDGPFVSSWFHGDYAASAEAPAGSCLHRRVRRGGFVVSLGVLVGSSVPAEGEDERIAGGNEQGMIGLAHYPSEQPAEVFAAIGIDGGKRLNAVHRWRGPRRLPVPWQCVAGHPSTT